MVTHQPHCPCNNADERGCFLISAKTNRCVSCVCESGVISDQLCLFCDYDYDLVCKMCVTEFKEKYFDRLSRSDSRGIYLDTV